MKLLSKLRGLRQKIGGGYNFEDIMFYLNLDYWNAMPQDLKDKLLSWAKQNKERDMWAYHILRKANGYGD